MTIPLLLENKSDDLQKALRELVLLKQLSKLSETKKIIRQFCYPVKTIFDEEQKNIKSKTTISILNFLIDFVCQENNILMQFF